MPFDFDFLGTAFKWLGVRTNLGKEMTSRRTLQQNQQSNSSKFRNGGSTSGASASLLQSHNTDLNNPTNGNANSSAGGVKKRKHFVPAGTASANMPVGDVTIKTEGMWNTNWSLIFVCAFNLIFATFFIGVDWEASGSTGGATASYGSSQAGQASLFQHNFRSVTSDGKVSLSISKQPERQHRARYQTEGSRGAVKDRSQHGFPTVQLKG